MNTKTSFAFLIQLLILAVPILLWKQIRNIEIKFILTLFILIFNGYLFFRLMESLIQREIKPGTVNDQRGHHIWFVLALQVFALGMFFVYSKRLFEIVKP